MQNETKDLTVREFAAKANTQEEKNLLRAMLSLKDIIPDLMDFPIVQQTFVYKCKPKATI